MGTAPPAARVFDPKGIENETRICVHYLWGGVLRIGSDPIPAVKLLPDPVHPPLKLECLYRGGYPRNRKV